MPVQIPYTANLTFTWDRGDPRTFLLTLKGDVVSSLFDMSVAPPLNTKFLFVIAQDVVGNRAFAWPAICKGPPPIGAPALQTTVQEFVLVEGPFLVPVGPPMYV